MRWGMIGILLLLPLRAEGQVSQIAVGAFMTSAGADLAVTQYGLGRGVFEELNPLLKPFEHKPVGMAVTKMGLSSVIAYYLLKTRHSHPKRALWVGVGLTLLNVAVTWRNVRLLEAAR